MIAHKEMRTYFGIRRGTMKTSWQRGQGLDGIWEVHSKQVKIAECVDMKETCVLFDSIFDDYLQIYKENNKGHSKYSNFQID